MPKASTRARETVLESVRRLLEAVADDVAPALGSLAAEYLREKKEPDPFFRGAARLLADLSTQEYQELGTLLGSICGSAGDCLAIERKPTIEGSVLEIRPLAVGDSVAQGAHQSECPQSFIRLCRQLKIHELAEDVPTGGFVGKGGPNVMLISRTTVDRLRLHVR